MDLKDITAEHKTYIFRVRFGEKSEVQENSGFLFNTEPPFFSPVANVEEDPLTFAAVVMLSKEQQQKMNSGELRWGIGYIKDGAYVEYENVKNLWD